MGRESRPYLIAKKLTKELEVVVLLAGFDDGVGKVDGPLSTLGPVVRRDSLVGSSGEGVLLDERELGRRVVGELVDGDDNLDAVLLCVRDVLAEVDAALLERLEVLVEVRVGQGLSGRDLGSSSVHLECSDGGHEDDGVGLEAGDSALDVAELCARRRRRIRQCQGSRRERARQSTHSPYRCQLQSQPR